MLFHSPDDSWGYKFAAIGERREAERRKQSEINSVTSKPPSQGTV
jgi:hypothetical protein